MARPVKHDREKTLDGALELFRERGYRGVSVKDVVDATGVLTGCLYSGFGNKDGLFTECVHHYAKASNRFYVDAEKVVSPLGQIEKLFSFMVEDSLVDTGQNGCFVINSLLEIAPDRPEIAKVLKNYVTISEGWIEERLKMAKEAGEIREDVDCRSLAECLFGVVYGARVKSRAKESDERIQSYVEQMLGALLNPVRLEPVET